ncbi:MAG: hypothetical protein Q9167_000224 [Letrouitia subvulpina]
MADDSDLPQSATLAPPRKSVELVDPGAHELENEDDVFSDAPEDPKSGSGSSSPIPITRVEKVDDRDNYGEVPGTEAYKKRLQDAVPDELEIIKEGERSSSSSSVSHPNTSPAAGGAPIPRTVVQKIDSTNPSHGEVPGTAAHAIRQADAVPDTIIQIPSSGAATDSQLDLENPTPDTPIPTTVVTKVDEQPSHGEIPGTNAYDIRQSDAKPDVVVTKGDAPGKLKSSGSALQRAIDRVSGSPIAADGGFGPMAYEESATGSSRSLQHEAPESDEEADRVAGDDFDDFEASAADEDFGDFDEPAPEPPKPEPPPVSKSPFVSRYILASELVTKMPFYPSLREREMWIQADCLPQRNQPVPNFSTHATLSEIIDSTSLHLDIIFPSTARGSVEHSQPPPPSEPPKSLFLTPRSHSLFTQLIATPPLSPPNWLRSRTRRLFLVSLGVPIDLDEILPASKQKKLILPSTLRNDSRSRRSDSRRRDRDRDHAHHLQGASSKEPGKERDHRRRPPKRRGTPPPAFDLPQVHLLCSTTQAALQNMTDDELRAHKQELERLTKVAGEVLAYWIKRREAAMGEKEMFESVVGDLVKHARRVRK